MSSIKATVQKLLERAGLYHRLKGSCLYDLYWRISDRRITDAADQEVSFYRALLEGLNPGDWIFDIGANHGHKTSIFLRLGANVLAVDPDEANQEALKDKFLRLRFSERPVVVVSKAVSDETAVRHMWIDEPGSAKNTLSQKWVDTLRSDESRFGHRLNFAQWKEVETTTLDELIKTYGVPYFIKIDVEGHEPQVIRGLKRPVPYLSFEVNLPEFENEGLECIDLLRKVDAEGTFNYAVDCHRGLALDVWLKPEEFRAVFQTCSEPSLEVYWKTAGSSGRR